MRLKDVGQSEEGQSLILVSLMIVVLMGFLAIAVDVGRVYAERRRMQNAADAGALAGARAICLGQSAAAAINTANDYAVNRNGAQTATASVNLQDSGGSITVTARETVNLFLAGFLGDSVTDVAATATASCGSASRMCNFWPIAFSLPKWNAMKAVTPFCGREFVVIDSGKICGVDYDCDTNGDGVDDIMMGGARGWLDLPWPNTLLFPTPCHSNCGQNKLGCFLENPYPGTISLPACIRSEPGTMTSAFMTAGGEAGKIVHIPLYDGECGSGDPSILGDCGGHEAYHITEVGCVEVVSFESKYPVYDLIKDKWSEEKALLVEVSCSPECYTGCGGTTGGTPGTGGVKGVSLLQ